MAQANDIDERSDWRIDADRQVLVDDESFAPDVEGVARKDMNRNRLSQGRNPAATGNSDVDLGRDCVREPVTRQSRNETKRPTRRAMGDFEQVLIDLVCIGPAIQAAPDLIQNALISPGVQPLRRQAGCAGLGVGKYGGQAAAGLDLAALLLTDESVYKTYTPVYGFIDAAPCQPGRVRLTLLALIPDLDSEGTDIAPPPSPWSKSLPFATATPPHSPQSFQLSNQTFLQSDTSSADAL